MAISKAGHDKGQLYVCIRSDETYVWLANGVNRPLDRPKKKKLKHVQLIKHLDFLSEYADIEALDNIGIKKILKTYKMQKEI